MGKKVNYYKKCLCCGNISKKILRDVNISSGMTDKDIYQIIAQSCKPENRIRVEFCKKCELETKQEDVAWNYSVEHK